MSMHDSIQNLIDKFHKKMEKNEDIKKEVMPLKKTINIDLVTEKYSMKIENAQITNFKDELLEEADITLISTSENLQALIDGTLRPMKAYIMKKITIKGKIQDVMFLRKFF
ncbi:MAG: SCP2 sterol-binding domain-containing protein [Candidatus Methanomethylophilaceae archaeon]|nr:SCP2 sterol-binding domain-containing protein [Candidatus Methanomethylophilaceae archaeon]MDY0224624.1 SCP2 sterol-binding domain-containing protein [Candidatus Methanomethylophilaceae archaeon]